nr:MAG TPA: hypothetical protein [Caudoviricetes sp.]
MICSIIQTGHSYASYRASHGSSSFPFTSSYFLPLSFV